MSSSAVARVFALAFLIAIGAGVYAFTQKSAVAAIQLKVDATEKELALWKTRTTQYQEAAKTSAASLDQCNAKVSELQTAVDEAAAAAAKRPGAKR
jgi:uncharacterized protein HemX